MFGYRVLIASTPSDHLRCKLRLIIFDICYCLPTPGDGEDGVDVTRLLHMCRVEILYLNALDFRHMHPAATPFGIATFELRSSWKVPNKLRTSIKHLQPLGGRKASWLATGCYWKSKHQVMCCGAMHLGLLASVISVISFCCSWVSLQKVEIFCYQQFLNPNFQLWFLGWRGGDVELHNSIRYKLPKFSSPDRIIAIFWMENA